MPPHKEHDFTTFNPLPYTYKALKTGQPVYLRDLLHYHQPARTLRSSSQLLLYQPGPDGKDQLSIQDFQYRCTNCLELSVFIY